MRRRLIGVACLGLTACATPDVFMPQSQYPPDPYVKGYADPEDCIGGEALAAVRLDLPEYPNRAFRSGQQGWTIARLNVATDGSVSDAAIERALPTGLFENSTLRAVESWQFEPPKTGALLNCRVLIRYRLGEVSLGG